MKAKIILVLTYPPSVPGEKLDSMARQFRKATKAWSESEIDHVLGIVVPEGTTVTGYAVPESALVELPEIVVKVECQEVPQPPLLDDVVKGSVDA